MNRRVTVWLSTAILLIWPTICCAQYLTNFSFLGGGPRARGMGGAYIALADDPSAATWNPAGSSLLDRPQTSFSIMYFRPRIEGNPQLTRQRDSISIPESFSTSYEGLRNRGRIPYGSLVIPGKVLGRQMVASVSYRTVAELFSNLNLKTDTTTFTQSIKGELNILNLAVGTKLLDRVALGAGLNVFMGGYDRLDVLSYTLNAGPYYQYYDTTAFLQYQNRWLQDSHYRGANYEIGGMYFGDKYRVGVLVRTGFVLKDKFEIQRGDTIFSDGIAGTFFINPPGVVYKNELPLQMPVTIGLGFSYKALENLTLAMDYEFRNYKKARYQLSDSLFNPAAESKSKELNWQGDHQVRFGLEYIYATPIGKIPVRVGVRNEPRRFDDFRILEGDWTLYIPPADQTPHQVFYNDQEVYRATAKRKDAIVGTAGIGIQWNQIYLDLTYELTRVNLDVEGKIFDPIFTPPTLDNQSSFTIRQKELSHRILFSFTGYF